MRLTVLLPLSVFLFLALTSNFGECRRRNRWGRCWRRLQREANRLRQLAEERQRAAQIEQERQRAARQREWEIAGQRARALAEANARAQAEELARAEARAKERARALERAMAQQREQELALARAQARARDQATAQAREAARRQAAALEQRKRITKRRQKALTDALVKSQRSLRAVIKAKAEEELKKTKDKAVQAHSVKPAQPKQIRERLVYDSVAPLKTKFVKCIKTLLKSCPKGYTKKGNRCLRIHCPKPLVRQGAKCIRVYSIVKPRRRCPRGFIARGSSCIQTTPIFCGAGYRAEHGRCILVSCSPGFTKVGQTCRRSCKLGFELRGELCLKLRRRCPENFYSKKGRCVRYQSGAAKCSTGYRLKGNDCVRSIASCPINFHRRGGRCVPQCPSGRVAERKRDGGIRCLIVKSKCLLGYSLKLIRVGKIDRFRCVINSGACATGFKRVKRYKKGFGCVSIVCPRDYVKKGKRCVRRRKRITKRCPSGYVRLRGLCRKLRCPSSHVRRGSRCVHAPCPRSYRRVDRFCARIRFIGNCPRGWRKVGEDSCHRLLCPSGFTKVGDFCMREACPSGFVRRGLACVRAHCAPGYKKKDGLCIERCPPGTRATKFYCVQRSCGRDFKRVGKSCVRATCPAGYLARPYRVRVLIKNEVRGYKQSCDCINSKPTATPRRNSIDVAFIVDVTGSMGSVIKDIQANIVSVINSNAESRVINQFVLVPFADPDIGPVTESRARSTVEKERLIAAVKKLNAAGGGDCPEMSHSAIYEALTRVKRNSVVYVFTDASATNRDKRTETDLLKLAREKNVQLNFLLTGNLCGVKDAYKTLSQGQRGAWIQMRRTDAHRAMQFLSKTLVRGGTALRELNREGLSKFIKSRESCTCKKIPQIRPSYKYVTSVSCQIMPKPRIIRESDKGEKCGEKKCQKYEKCIAQKSEKKIKEISDEIASLQRSYSINSDAASRQYAANLQSAQAPVSALSAQDRHACEHESVGISCPQNYRIQILEGFYGRTSDRFCARGPRRTFRCSSSRANSVISSMCNGKQSCTISSSNSVFGDPCVGTFKYTVVKYRCLLDRSVESQIASRRAQIAQEHSRRVAELQTSYNQKLADLNSKLSEAKRGTKTCVPRKDDRPLCGKVVCSSGRRCIVKTLKRRVGAVLRDVKTASCEPIKDLCRNMKCKSGFRCRVVYKFKRVSRTVTRTFKKCPCSGIFDKPDTTSRKVDLVDMAFVVDTTGSMGKVISGILADIKQIVAANKGTISKFVISPFNDPKVGPLTVSDDSNKIFAAVNALKANGGGDCPEMSMAGILAAAESVKPGSVIYVFTDASAKDLTLREKVRDVVTKKSLQMIFLITGHLCGNKYHNEYQYLSSGNGQVIQLTTDRIQKVLSFIRQAISFGAERLRRLNVSQLDNFIRKCECRTETKKVQRNFYEYHKVAKCTNRPPGVCTPSRCSKGFRCVQYRAKSRRGSRLATRCVRNKDLCSKKSCQKGTVCAVRYFGRVVVRDGREVKLARRKAACVEPPPSLCQTIRCGRFESCVVEPVKPGASPTARCVGPKPKEKKCGTQTCKTNEKCVSQKSEERIKELTEDIKRQQSEYASSLQTESRKNSESLAQNQTPIRALGEQEGHACENESVGISCPQNYRIQILEGFYGRTSDRFCARGPRWTFRCSSVQANSVISSMCNGKQSCTISSSNSVFGDPCVGTFKYTTVRYRCLLDQSVENQIASRRAQIAQEHSRRVAELQTKHNQRMTELNNKLLDAREGTKRCVPREEKERLCSEANCKGSTVCVVYRVLTNAGRSVRSIKQKLYKKYESERQRLTIGFRNNRRKIKDAFRKESKTSKENRAQAQNENRLATVESLRNAWKLRRKYFVDKLKQERRLYERSLHQLRLQRRKDLSNQSKRFAKLQLAEKVAKCVPNLCLAVKCNAGFSCRHVSRFTPQFKAFLKEKRVITEAYLLEHKRIVSSYYKRDTQASADFQKYLANHLNDIKKVKTNSAKAMLKAALRNKIRSYKSSRRESLAQYRRSVKNARDEYAKKLKALRSRVKKATLNKRVATVARCIPVEQKSCKDVKCSSGKRCVVRSIPTWWHKLYQASIKGAYRRFLVRLNRAARRLRRLYEIKKVSKPVSDDSRVFNSFRRWLTYAISQISKAKSTKNRRSLENFLRIMKETRTRLWGRFKKAAQRYDRRFRRSADAVFREAGSKTPVSKAIASELTKCAKEYANRLSELENWYEGKVKQFDALYAKLQKAGKAEKPSLQKQLAALYKEIRQSYRSRLRRTIASYYKKKRYLRKTLKKQLRQLTGRRFVRRAMCVATNPCSRKRCGKDEKCIVQEIKEKTGQVTKVGRCEKRVDPCSKLKCPVSSQCVVQRIPTEEYQLYRWHAKISRHKFHLKLRSHRRRLQRKKRRSEKKAIRKHRKLVRSAAKQLRGRRLARRIRNLKKSLRRALRRYRDRAHGSFRYLRGRLRSRLQSRVRRYYRQLVHRGRKYKTEAACIQREYNPCLTKRCPNGSRCVAKKQPTRLYSKFHKATRGILQRYLSAKQNWRKRSLRKKLRKIWRAFKRRGVFKQTTKLVANCHKIKENCPKGFERQGPACFRFHRVCPSSYIKTIIKNEVQCIKFSKVCPLSHFKSDDRCLQKCPDGTKASSNRVCELVKPCSEFLLETSCVKSCPENFIVVDQKCRRCPEMSVRWGNSCFRREIYCRSGFAHEGSCVKKCPKHTYISGRNCLRARCPRDTKEKFSKGGLECVKKPTCKEGLLYYAGSCYSKCPKGTLRRGSTCQKSCKKGYIRVGVRKQTCIREFCINRLRIGTSCVTKCPFGYIGVGRTCQKFNLSCPPGYTKLGKALCLKDCPSGFTKRGDICEFSACQKGTFRYKGACVKSCPIGTQVRGSYCLERSDCKLGRFYYAKLCLAKCPPGHYRSFARRSCIRLKRCDKGQLRLRRFCLKSCPLGFKQVRENCRRISTCQNGYVYRGACTPKCPTGTRAVRGSCEAITRLCPSDHLLLIKPNGERSCVQTCPEDFVAVKSSGTCKPTRCPKGTFRLGNVCRKDCPKDFEAIEDRCQEIKKLCQSGLLQLNQTCVKQCPSGYKPVDGHCRQPLSKCSEGTFMFNGACVKSCPKEYTGRTFQRADGQTIRYCRRSRVCSKGQVLIYERKLDQKTKLSKYTSKCVSSEKPCTSGFALKRRVVRINRGGKLLRRVLRLCIKTQESCAKGLFMYRDKCLIRCPRGTRTMLDRKAEKVVQTCRPKCGLKYILGESCVAKCPIGYESKHFGRIRLCKKECPRGKFSFKNECIARCPSGYSMRTFQVYSRVQRKVVPLISCAETKCAPGYRMAYRISEKSKGGLLGVCERIHEKTCQYPSALAFGICYKHCPNGYYRRTKTVRGRRLGFCVPTERTELCSRVHCDGDKICVLSRRTRIFKAGKTAVRRSIRKAICVPRFCKTGLYRHDKDCVSHCPDGYVKTSVKHDRTVKGRKMQFTERLCSKKHCKFPMARLGDRCVKSCPTKYEKKVYSFNMRYKNSRIKASYAVCRHDLCFRITCSAGQKCFVKTVKGTKDYKVASCINVNPCATMKCAKESKCLVRLVSGQSRAVCVPNLPECKPGLVLFHKSCINKCPEKYQVISVKKGARLYRRCARDTCPKNGIFFIDQCVQRCPVGFSEESIKYSDTYSFKYCSPKLCKSKLFRLGASCVPRCPPGFRRRYFKTKRDVRRYCFSSLCPKGTYRLGKSCVISCPKNYKKATVTRASKPVEACVPEKCPTDSVFVDGHCIKTVNGCYDKSFVCKSMERRKQCNTELAKLLCPASCGKCDPKKRDLCTCTSMGSHYQTFDGQWIHFTTKCGYQLAQSKLDNSSECNFLVTAKNEVRGKRHTVTWTRFVDIKIHNITIRLHQKRRVFFNGKKIERLPISFYNKGKNIRIYLSGQNVVAESKYCGLYLEFNGRSVAVLHVPKSRFAGKVEGICGNCNGDPKDDLKSRDGKDVSALGAEGFVQIGLSYLVASTTKKCNVSPAPSNECRGSMQQRVKSNKFCGLISDKKGPFGACLHSGKVDFVTLYKNCESDVCQYETGENRRKTVCQSLEALYNVCLEKGFKVSWRSRRFCPIKCPANAVFRQRMSACPSTCVDFGRRRECSLPDREGCDCKKGFVLNGQECVPKISCGKVVPLDLAFVIDGTDDVSADEFESIKDLVIKLLTKYRLSFLSVRPALAVFGRTNPVISLFNERPEKPEFMGFVRAQKKTGGSAENLDAALRITNMVIMSPIGGARPDVPKYVILIKKSIIPAASDSAVNSELEALKKSNVRIIIVSLPPTKPTKPESSLGGLTIIPARVPPYLTIPEIIKELEKTAGCPSGFEAKEKHCVDVNECAAKVSPCHPDSTCVNVPGSYICLCRPGFLHDITRGCVVALEEKCPAKPKCDSGYSFDEGTKKCVDIDECMEVPCLDKEATCVNTPGSFKCTCKTGYEYNKHFGCIDIDECKGKDPCAGAGKCVNTLGSFNCTCDEGYAYKFGLGCKDIDECATGTHNCKGGAKCNNTIGSYSCSCDSGYRYTKNECLDIDECAEDSKICDASATCVNQKPGYKCQCKQGDKWVHMTGSGCVPDEKKGMTQRKVDFIFTIDGGNKLIASAKDIQDFLIRLLNEFTAHELTGLSVRVSVIVMGNSSNAAVQFSQAYLAGIEDKIRAINLPGGSVSLLEGIRKAAEEKVKARKGSTPIILLITGSNIAAGDVNLPQIKRFADNFKSTGKFFTIQISPEGVPADWSALYSAEEITHFVTVIRSSEITTIYKLFYMRIYPQINCPEGYVKVDNLCQLQALTLQFCKTDGNQLRALGSAWQDECSEFKCGSSGIEVVSRKCLGYDGQCYSTEEYFPCTQVTGTLTWKCRCKLISETNKEGKKVESLLYQSIAASTEVVMTDQGRPCTFPFKYQNKWYYNCDAYEGRYWCSFHRLHETGSWGYCVIKESKNRCTDPFDASKIYMEGDRWNNGCNVMECTATGLKRIPKCEAADKTCKALNEDGYACNYDGKPSKNCICVQDSSGWGKNEIVSGNKAKEVISSGGALVSVCVDRSTTKRYEQGQEWVNSCLKYRCTASGGQLLSAACQQKDGNCRNIGEKNFDCVINGSEVASCECSKDDSGNPMLTAVVSGLRITQVVKVTEVKTSMETTAANISTKT